MMVETSTPSTPPQPKNSDLGQRTEEEAPIVPTPTPAPPPPPPPPRKPKTWAIPKAPGKPKDDNDDDDAKEHKDGGGQVHQTKERKKKTLLEIMAEEEEQRQQDKKKKQQQEIEQRLVQEEEAALLQALKASMTTTTNSSTSTTTVGDIGTTGGGDSTNDDDMDEDMKLALLLSMQDDPVGSVTAGASVASTAVVASSVAASVPPVASVAAASARTQENNIGISEEELKAIEKALQEADDAEAQQSFQLAMKLHQQEGQELKQQTQKKLQPQGHVRTLNRTEFLKAQGKGGGHDHDHDYDDDDYDDDNHDHDYDFDEHGTLTVEAGFRMNSTKPSPSWSRSTDRGSTIIGPNQEIRTKHDLQLQGQANAYRLELRSEDHRSAPHVGNQAYNAFHSRMQKKTIKGVAAHGHGRATADTDKTRDGALDGRVRLHIARAVNNGLLDAFHGCVKEGKEALVFHADQGTKSEGYDVAVKVFKRIQEFKNRKDYVSGDPRYGDGTNFKHAGSRQQIEIWAEKEYRNLIRAYRANVPVPKPLWYKENVVFLRFLGDDGWPSPQLRELQLKRGSKTWMALYEQTMSALQRLYCDARLVHGDLSEYNILVCPGRFLKRVEEVKEGEEEEEKHEDEEEGMYVDAKDGRKDDLDDGDKKLPVTTDSGDKKPLARIDNEKKPAGGAAAAVTFATDIEEDQRKSPPTAGGEEKRPAITADAETKPAAVATAGELKSQPELDDDSLQVVLIDFGQAVDIRHGESHELLQRDVTRVKQFFDKMGITTISVEAAMSYVQTKNAPLR